MIDTDIITPPTEKTENINGLSVDGVDIPM